MTLDRIFDDNLLDKLAFNNNSQVFIYTVNLSDVKHNIPNYWECLSQQEKRKARQYATENLCNDYIISRGILRYILSYYIEQKPHHIEFIYNRYGKPSLRNNNLQFNLSHSNRVVSYIIALDHHVGIDIEWRNRALSIEEFAESVLTLAEYKFFSILKDKEKTNFFFDQWTKKESLVKAYGQGLSYPINTIEVMELSPGDNISIGGQENEFKLQFYYFPIDMLPDYSGCIAIGWQINHIVYLKMSCNSNTFNICEKSDFMYLYK